MSSVSGILQLPEELMIPLFKAIKDWESFSRFITMGNSKILRIANDTIVRRDAMRRFTSLHLIKDFKHRGRNRAGRQHWKVLWPSRRTKLRIYYYGSTAQRLARYDERGRLHGLQECPGEWYHHRKETLYRHGRITRIRTFLVDHHRARGRRCMMNEEIRRGSIRENYEYALTGRLICFEKSRYMRNLHCENNKRVDERYREDDRHGLLLRIDHQGFHSSNAYPYREFDKKYILRGNTVKTMHMNDCNISTRHSIPFQRGFMFYGISMYCDCNHTREQWEEGPSAKLRESLIEKDFSACADIVHCGMIHSDDIEIKFADGRIVHRK